MDTRLSTGDDVDVSTVRPKRKPWISPSRGLTCSAMAIQANVHEAKTRFSELLERAHKGEEVIIAKAGKPYARLVALTAEGVRQPGHFKGRICGDPTGPVGSDDCSWG